MKISGDWINKPETQAVCAMLEGAGFQALFVGGCVRNALLGEPVADIDITTDAKPDDVMQLAQKSSMKSIPTGLDHGTVTVVSGVIPHEVTTFRKDVETFGRHATVAFSGDMLEDASRRDFTMNALYSRPDGEVIDPLGAMQDLHARRVRFIDDAGQRIREDYLRILRFFRFHAWYGDPVGGFDEDGLAAVADNVDGLDGLSRERVGTEIVKLLTAPDPVPSIAAMRSVGILHRVLPGADDQYLALLVHLENEIRVSASPVRRLACLGGENIKDLLRLSKPQDRALKLLKAGISNTMGAAELAYRYGYDAGRDIVLLRAALFERVIDSELHEKLCCGVNADFPVSAQDLISNFSGRDLGVQLKKTEQRWIDSGFTLSKDDLL